jgi:8-oxo-dGTP pyrophosphatase MutT (NUDIX family)
VAPHPAATVIVLRDGAAGPEVFLVRRHEGTRFMGGAHVFPGGRVDAGDYDAAGDADETWCDGIAEARSRLAGLAPREAIAYHLAAARELFEEAGVLLARDEGTRYVSLTEADGRARFTRYRHEIHSGSQRLRALVAGEGLRLALDALVPFAHWVTPPVDVRRFDTRFFITRVPPDQTPAHDETETTDSAWITAGEAIARCGRLEIDLPPPTWTTLREIEMFGTVADVITWAQGRDIVRREPRFVEHDGRKMLLLAGDPLHPEAPGELAHYETRFVLTGGRWRAEVAPA